MRLYETHHLTPVTHINFNKIIITHLFVPLKKVFLIKTTQIRDRIRRHDDDLIELLANYYSKILTNHFHHFSYIHIHTSTSHEIDMTL